MGLHLRCSRLQLSPYEESGDSSDVSRGRGVFVGRERPSRASTDPATARSESKKNETWTTSKSRRPFFRSLLGRRPLLLATLALLSRVQRLRASNPIQSHAQGRYVPC